MVALSGDLKDGETVSIVPLNPNATTSFPAGKEEVAITWPCPESALKVRGDWTLTELKGKTEGGTLFQFWTACRSSLLKLGIWGAVAALIGFAAISFTFSSGLGRLGIGNPGGGASFTFLESNSGGTTGSGSGSDLVCEPLSSGGTLCWFWFSQDDKKIIRRKESNTLESFIKNILEKDLTKASIYVSLFSMFILMLEKV
jgi:hypothetical protein